MASKKNEVATTVKNEVALPFDYSEYADDALNLSMADLSIPFVSLVQSDSKVLDPDEENYIPGGSAGQLVNASTRSYHDELYLVPAVKDHKFVEWLPDRGGYAGEHDPESNVVKNAIRTEDGTLRRSDGPNELAETKSLWCIICEGEDLNPVGFCVVPFTGSKFRPWRHYWDRINTLKGAHRIPPMALSIRLASKDEKNPKGKKYKNFVMHPARDENGALTRDPNISDVKASLIPPTHPAFQAAADLREAIKAGRATADRDTSTVEPNDGHF
jgi:hypothetical protein